MLTVRGVVIKKWVCETLPDRHLGQLIHFCPLMYTGKGKIDQVKAKNEISISISTPSHVFHKKKSKINIDEHGLHYQGQNRPNQFQK